MELVAVYKKAIIDLAISWVLFENGTCVMILKPENDLRAQAIEIIKSHGSAIPGSPSGDFDVTKIPKIDGWLITGDYPGIMDYVSSQEGKRKDDFEIGMIGRMKRESDAKTQKVVHIEDKRKILNDL